MKVSDAISHALIAEGVTLAAGISGQSIGHVLDSIAESPKVSLIYAGHKELEDRVWRLKGLHAHTQRPKSRLALYAATKTPSDGRLLLDCGW